jgi:transposase
MFIRPYFKTVEGQRRAYWALVESYRTQRGSRQRIVAWLGQLDEAGRLGVKQAALDHPLSAQKTLFPKPEPEWVEVDASRVRVENCRQFGGPWLAFELIKRLGLDRFLCETMPQGGADVPWSTMALVLVIARLCDPSSELSIAETFIRNTCVLDLLGVSAEKVYDNRLYRALDQLLPHKAKLETFLKQKLGELFDLEYDLLLYDVTSTYFEGEAKANPLAQRGYSRDNRSDCKQVCIGLVVSRCGMPLGYEVFAGNTADSTTVEHIVETMENRYGKSDRIWVMDRGMISEDKIAFLRKGKRRYLVGTPKPMLKRFEQEILKDDWHQVREGLEVKLCAWPGDEDAEETDAEVGQEDPEIFILCRSQDRFQKEDAIVRRFEQKIEARLTRMQARCERQRRDVAKVEREVGRVLGQNTRAARLFDVRVERTDEGGARLSWSQREAVRDWATLSAGCYLLRTNVTDWSDEDLWKTYIQLTEAEAAFRIHKSDLSLRPIWHQKQDRVLAHILVCFLAYVLWKTLAAFCQRAGLGDEPRRVLKELEEIRVVDVVLPTRNGIEITKRCLTKPSEHQSLLLHQLGFALPSQKNQIEM